MSITLSVTAADAGQRLDIFCALHQPAFSRTSLQKAIKEGQITVNDQTVKPRYLIQNGDQIGVNLSLPSSSDCASSPPLNPPLLYEDKHLVVINKPPGVATHPGIGQEKMTVASWFIERWPANSSVGENSDRPGIVHRLDKDTSGVLVLAKTPEAYIHLKNQFLRRRAKKEYLALVFGVPRAVEGRINQPLIRSPRNPLRRTIFNRLSKFNKNQADLNETAAKPAITEWRLEQKFADYALLRVFPYTGRTHQIRVHLHFIGHPIAGDQLYTFKRQKPPPGVTRQMLHAEKLTLTLPSGKLKTFLAPLPEDFASVLKALSN